jgi:hypothetical protein
MRLRYEFRVAPSTTRPGVQVCEVWIENKMVAAITPSDHHGIRVISRWTLMPVDTIDIGDGVKMTQVEFNTRAHQ